MNQSKFIGLCWVGIVCFLAWSACTATEKHVLVKDSKAACAIVISKDAGPIEKHASAELRTYLKKVSGAEVTEVETLGKDSKTFPIYLGTPENCPEIKSFGLAEKVKGLSDEGFVIKTDSKGLLIAARKPIGVLYGVYTFLEDNLGIRWFFPGEKGEYCPKTSTIEIGKIDEIQNPAFTVRWINYVCAGMNAGSLETWDWCVRNKMQVIEAPWRKYQKELLERGEIRFGCIQLRLGDDLFKDHPEYFCLFNGKRHLCESAEGVFNVCTSNPDVIDLLANQIIDLCQETHRSPADDLFDKTADLIGIANIDTAAFCQCDKCRALDDPVEQKQGIMTTRFYKFANAVIEKVAKKYPDKRYVGWAYQVFQSPPKGIKPDSRVYIMMAMHGRCYSHSYGDANCPVNADKISLLKDWLKFGNVTGVHEYYSDWPADFGFPYVPQENVVAGDIKYLSKIGVKFWRVEVPPTEGIFGFADYWKQLHFNEVWYAQFATYYLASKLLWNPDLDVNKLKEDMYQKYYGAAMAPMKAYRELLTESYNAASHGGHFVYGYAAMSWIASSALREPGREDELLQYLAQAEKAAGNDQALQEKIAREKKYFADSWQKFAVPQGPSSPTDDDWNCMHKRTGAIVIDGNLNKPDWKQGGWLTSFVRENTREPATNRTFFKLMYDNSNLYVAVAAMEPTPDKLVAKNSKRDTPLYKDDDDIEIFLDSANTGSNCYEFAVNPNGTIYDARWTSGACDPTWNGDCKAACKTLSNRWVVEMRIGAAAMNTRITDGVMWKINVARHRRTGTPETSTWQYDGIINQPRYFRPFYLGEFGTLSGLKNGGFECVQEVKVADPKAPGVTNTVFKPVDWGIYAVGNLSVISNDVHSGHYAAKSDNILHSPGFGAANGDTLHINFWAKGNGMIDLGLYYFTAGNDPIGTDYGAVARGIPLTTAWKEYRYDFKIAKTNVGVVQLLFTGNITIDDVYVVKSINK